MILFCRLFGMAIDVVQLVKDGLGRIEWGWVSSEHNGSRLAVAVFRDAMKFDNQPDMNWGRNPLPTNELNYGVRLPATAHELQQIADHLGCMLMTPKIVDLVWQEAANTGIQFEPVVNVKGKIVAVSNINDVHDAVEAAVVKAGGDPGEGAIVASVGKYWVLSNRLMTGKFGTSQAVNYGWPTRGKGVGKSVTGGFNVWQTVGSAHNDQHVDPSQVIRLMYRWGRILRSGSRQWEDIDLHEVATNSDLAPLISHEGVLKTLRQRNVPAPETTTAPDGSIVLPETIVYALPKSRWEVVGSEDDLIS